MTRYDDEKWFTTSGNMVVRKCIDASKSQGGSVAKCMDEDIARFIALSPTIAYALSEVILAYDSGSLVGATTCNEDHSITYARGILRAAWNTDRLPHWNPMKMEWEFG